MSGGNSTTKWWLYRALSVLLLALFLGSTVLEPLAAAAPSQVPASSPSAEALQAPADTVAPEVLANNHTGDETGPTAVIPDLPAKKEVVRRTEFSVTERNADSSFSTTFSPERPMHFRDAEGAFKPFQNALRPTTAEGFSHENTANGFVARFEQASDVAAGRPVTRFATSEGAVSMVALGARPSRASVNGARITYTDAYPDGAALTYLLDNERLKEEVILERAPSSASSARYSFDLTLEGVTAAKQPDGSIDIVESSGKVAFRMPKPFMIDSSGVPESEYSNAVAVTLTEQPNGKLRLELVPDLAWLQDAARVYPVRIDPTVERVTYSPDGATGKDLHIVECCPTQNNAGHSQVHVGKNASGQRRDTLIQFTELDTLPQDSAITLATLKLYADSGTNGLPMEVRRNTAAWEESTATWGNQANSMGTEVWTSPTSTVPGSTLFDLKGLVRKFVRGEIPNYGVRILSKGGANESVPFHSSNSTEATKRPQLTVTYMPATRLGVSDLWDYVSQDHSGGNTSSVNVSTGNVAFQHDGGTIATRGFEVDLVHTYNSQDPYGQTDYYDRPGAYWGEGWTFSQNLKIYERDDGRAVLFKDGAGGADRVYVRNIVQGTTQTYFRPLYYDMTLTRDLSSTADPSRTYTLKPDSGGEVMYFDGGGKLRRIEDRNGNYLSYSYDTDGTNIADPNGRLTRITDVAGRVTSLEYTGPGNPARLSKITDMAGRVHTYSYDNVGNLTTIKHGVGTLDEVTTTLGYGVGNQLTSVTNPRGHRSLIRYKVLNQWDSNTAGWVADSTNTVVEHTATPAFRGGGSLKLTLASVTALLPGGASKTYATPESWNSVQQELMAFARVSASDQLQARLVLTDSRDRTVIGPAAPLTGNAWTAVRMPDAHVDPAYKVKKVSVQFLPVGASYSGTVYLDHLTLKGVADSLTDSKPTPYTTAKLEYNWNVKTTTVSDPDQDGVLRDTMYTYDRDGQVLETTDPLGNKGTAAYDGDLRLTSTTGPDNRTSRLSYYPNSNEVRTVTSPAGEVGRRGVNLATGDERYVIDARNEKRRTENQEYVAYIYVRDSAGNVTSEQINRYAMDTDPATVDLEADPLPAPVATLRRMDYSYGPGGELASMTDPNGNVTYYEYQTSTGYLTKIDTPPGAGETERRVSTISLNPDGTPNQSLDPKGQKTTYEYDSLGDLVKVNYGMQDGAADFFTGYTLDDNGNITAMSDKEGASSWAYDENDAPTSESRTQNGVTRTARYAYYPNDQLSTLTTFANQTVTYSYDALGRLLSQSDPKDGGRAITFTYDNLSRPVSTAYPSGVSRQLAYDTADNLKQIKLQRNDGAVLQRFDYKYGINETTGELTPEYFNGFVREVAELDGSKVSYGYDDLGRLVSAVRIGSSPYSHSYSYDANNNRISATIDGIATAYTYDAADQLVRQGNINFRYDRNGNTLDDGRTVYTYDASNRLVGGTTANGVSLAFGYDGEGRRISRTVGAARTDYWYDATGMALETGSTSATYLRDSSGELLSRTRGTTVANYATDRLGNVTALLDGQELVNSYTYDPYGQEVATTGTYYNPYRYTSTYQDTETRLYQMGARYYQPGTGSFTQQDPLPSSIFEGQRYGYTSGNPVNYTDPTGLHRVRRQNNPCTGHYSTFDYDDYGRVDWYVTYRFLPNGRGGCYRQEFKRFRSRGRLHASHAPPLIERPPGRRSQRAHRWSRSRAWELPRGYTGSRWGGGFGGGGGACFSADTLVATKNGKMAISKVRIGDRVLAHDEVTGTVGSYKVTAVHIREAVEIEYLIIDGERIETTPEHPFYVQERRWVPAGELRKGTRVRQLDGTYGTVESVELLRRRQTMYNLTVDTAHTYFVGMGRWLVHNNYKGARMW